MSYSYSGDPSASDTAAVRFELGDTEPTSPLLQDEEIEFCIAEETGIPAAAPATITGAALYRAGAHCMNAVARKFAAQADTTIGSTKVTYSTMAEKYAARAQELLAKAAGMNAPYAGGLSVSEKRSARQESDLVSPAFTRREHDSPWGASRPTNLGPFEP